jgi:hypothetical protein
MEKETPLAAEGEGGRGEGVGKRKKTREHCTEIFVCVVVYDGGERLLKLAVVLEKEMAVKCGKTTTKTE